MKVVDKVVARTTEKDLQGQPILQLPGFISPIQFFLFTESNGDYMFLTVSDLLTSLTLVAALFTIM